jgi:hypothetical protein
MQIAVIEARYSYKMSYLDEWQAAWADVSSYTRTYNVLKASDLSALSRQISQFDLIVVLHSVTADSNEWMPLLSPLLFNRKSKLIVFVGNEYSNPWLSMEVRLKNLSDIYPDIVATQLPISAGKFLYKDVAGDVVEVPHALPLRRTKPDLHQVRKVDLGFRGFEYPWFLLDQERNSVIDSVRTLFESKKLVVDISKSERLSKDEWYEFLRNTKCTVSSEGGSRYVFKTDEVWKEALHFLQTKYPGKFLANDFKGIKILRSLPAPVKSSLRGIARVLGREQGATSALDSTDLNLVLSRINPDDFEFVSGKAVTSRHLDSIYCGTWQILSQGSYNQILKQGQHFTLWDPTNPEKVIAEVAEALENGQPDRIYDELIDNNSYSSRINSLLDRI